MTREGDVSLVFLGTGTPNPDPTRQGPSLAIIVAGQAYLVDCGPGVVRRAAAAHIAGVDSLGMGGLTRLFITHLHSDHTVGLPDLIFTPAVTGRKEPLSIWGPLGTRKMVDHICTAWSQDRETRLHGGEPAISSAYEVRVEEVDEGNTIALPHLNVKVFRVHHGTWLNAFGYRFHAQDKTIVVSGDTTYCHQLIDNASGCDILVHEAYSSKGLKNRTPEWQAYHSSYHTSGPDVGRIATVAQAKLVVLTHVLAFGETVEQVVEEVRSTYDGEVVAARDLQRFEL